MQDDGSWSEEKEDILKDVLGTFYVGELLTESLPVPYQLTFKIFLAGADTVSLTVAES